MHKKSGSNIEDYSSLLRGKKCPCLFSSKLFHGLLHGVGRDSLVLQPQGWSQISGWEMAEVVGAGGVGCNNCFV